jgi:hypothetical protein
MSTLVLLVVCLLQAAPPAPSGQTLADDVAKLAAASSNEERFAALTGLLRARGVPFEVEPFALDEPIGREPRTEGRNVVVSVGEGAGGLLIGAHYDAARLADGALSGGAVDNGASSVLLVRLAERLRAEPLPVRVRVVWFDMEELGLIGSRRWLERHAADRPDAMLNFDVNAYGDTVVFGPSSRPEHAGLKRALLQTCASQGVDCIAFPQMPPGDDRSFVQAGIPTLSIAVIPAIDAHQLWLLMNGGPDSGLAPGVRPTPLQIIHTAGDTMDKVDERSLAMMLRFTSSLVRTVAREVSGAPAVR